MVTRTVILRWFHYIFYFFFCNSDFHYKDRFFYLMICKMNSIFWIFYPLHWDFVQCLMFFIIFFFFRSIFNTQANNIRFFYFISFFENAENVLERQCRRTHRKFPRLSSFVSLYTLALIQDPIVIMLRCYQLF